jgi:hypothetical protein
MIEWLVGGGLLYLVSQPSKVERMKTMDKKTRIQFVSQLATERGIPPAVALAILDIESSGRPFGSDGRMIIRFEPHHFKDANGNKIPLEVKRGGQAGEWDTFTRAAAINPDAAMRAISMGEAQIMGFNHQMVGHPTVKSMFDAFNTSHQAQITGFFDFVKAAKLEDATRTGDWLRFACKYNGSGQRGYDAKIDARYQYWVKQGLPGLAGRPVWTGPGTC